MWCSSADFSAESPVGGDNYEGGRSFDALLEFATKKLKPQCTPRTVEYCDADQKKILKDLLAMPAEDRQRMTAEADQKIQEVEAKFKADTQKLQDEYKAIKETETATLAKINSAELRLLKTIDA